MCFGIFQIRRWRACKNRVLHNPLLGAESYFKLSGEPVLALGGGHSFDGVAERGARHCVAVRFEIVAQHIDIAFAHFAQHPAYGLVDKVVWV